VSAVSPVRFDDGYAEIIGYIGRCTWPIGNARNQP
jgi:hypothetical protein